VPTEQEWTEIARASIRELIGDRRAVVWPEVVALLAEPLGTTGRSINPLPLQRARLQMLREHELTERAGTTRGGRQVVTITLPGTAGRTTTAVAARKRLLYSRYLGWSAGTEAKPGIIGPSLERAVHASLLSAAPVVGYKMLNPSTGQVEVVAGVTLFPPYGPLDNAFLWQTWDSGERVAILVEAKNLRDWVYPGHPELYQLLAKAAYVASANPDIRVVPVLVCRMAQKNLFYMAKEVGFHVIDTKRQLISFRGHGDPDAEEKLAEVRSELGFFDMLTHDGPHKLIANQFTKTLPRVMKERAETWTHVGSLFEEIYREIIAASTTRDRDHSKSELRDAIKQINDLGLSW